MKTTGALPLGPNGNFRPPGPDPVVYYPQMKIPSAVTEYGLLIFTKTDDIVIVRSRTATTSYLSIIGLFRSQLHRIYCS